MADLRNFLSTSEKGVCTFNNMASDTVVAKIQWSAELCEWLHGAGDRHPQPYQRPEETPSQGPPAGTSASPQWGTGEMFLASWSSSLSDITMIYISSDSEGRRTPSSHGSLEQLELDMDDETADQNITTASSDQDDDEE